MIRWDGGREKSYRELAADFNEKFKRLDILLSECRDREAAELHEHVRRLREFRDWLERMGKE